MNTRTADIQKVAGARIVAKASTLYSNQETCTAAWEEFQSLCIFFMHRYGLNEAQFASELQSATAELFANELKTEIFGYSINEVAA